MQLEQLKEVIHLCEKSKLGYFKYLKNGTEIVFNKSAQLQSEIQNQIQSHTSQASLVKHEEKVEHENASQGEVSDEVSAVKDEDLFEVTSNFVGIIHLEELVNSDENDVMIEKGNVLCSVEAMKIYNDIVSPIDGVIDEILVNEGDQVEYKQVLFRIRVC